MDQDRRDAAAWAKEWYIRQKNRRILYAIVFIAACVLIGFMINFIVIKAERSTFSSEEEMRKALQGRFAIERDYEDIVIEGDDITLTYLETSHYDRDYAERYGYNYDYDDSVYKDHIVEWDYRHGVIRSDWMEEIIVDKNGNLRRGKYWVFYKTDKPRPEPIDPSTLKNPKGSYNEELPEDEQEELDEVQEDLEATEDAAKEAGEGEGAQDTGTEVPGDEQA